MPFHRKVLHDFNQQPLIESVDIRKLQYNNLRCSHLYWLARHNVKQIQYTNRDVERDKDILATDSAIYNSISPSAYFSNSFDISVGVGVSGPFSYGQRGIQNVRPTQLFRDVTRFYKESRHYDFSISDFKKRDLCEKFTCRGVEFYCDDKHICVQSHVYDNYIKLLIGYSIQTYKRGYSFLTPDFTFFHQNITTFDREYVFKAACAVAAVHAATRAGRKARYCDIAEFVNIPDGILRAIDPGDWIERNPDFTGYDRLIPDLPAWTWIDDNMWAYLIINNGHTGNYDANIDYTSQVQPTQLGY